uniref:Transcription elongation factor A (SII), 1 n=1 Tax=Monopterus albus TaxID=43700 RepID=A0A3Q3KIM8_MONAL
MGKKEEEEVIRIAKKMDKMAQKKNGAGALDLLKELRSVPMTLELLQSTRIGMSVNAIRKQSTDEEVTSLAKSLIKSWKKLLDEPGGGEKPSDEKRKEQAAPVVSPSQGSPEAKEESSSSSNSSSKSEPTEVTPNTLISTFPRAPSTSDSIRLKCREMLASALQTGDDYIAIGADCEELGAQIEEYILFYMKYKNRVRSRISNLKDMKNPNLRRTVLCGSVTPERMAKMTAEEMASDELKEMRKNLTKEAVRDHQMATTGGTQTDLFTCGKWFVLLFPYQVQTRSADEPMTTFVFCNECGNRWKVCWLTWALLTQSWNPSANIVSVSVENCVATATAPRLLFYCWSYVPLHILHKQQHLSPIWSLTTLHTDCLYLHTYKFLCSTCHCSLAFKHKLSYCRYKTIHRTHITQGKMFKMGFSNTDTSSQCTRGCTDDYFHATWTCQPLYSLWVAVTEKLSTILSCRIHHSVRNGARNAAEKC